MNVRLKSFGTYFLTVSGWWFGTFCIFPYIENVIIPTDFHIFQRGRYTTSQTCWILFLFKNPLTHTFLQFLWISHVNSWCFMSQCASRETTSLAWSRRLRSLSGDLSSLPRWQRCCIDISVYIYIYYYIILYYVILCYIVLYSISYCYHIYE